MGCASADIIHAVGLEGDWHVGAHTCTSLMSVARTTSHSTWLAGWQAGRRVDRQDRSLDYDTTNGLVLNLWSVSPAELSFDPASFIHLAMQLLHYY